MGFARFTGGNSIASWRLGSASWRLGVNSAHILSQCDAIGEGGGQRSGKYEELVKMRSEE